MSDQYFASAFVRIKPDTVGFQKALREQVKASIASAGVFKVPVALEPLAFKKAIQAELRSATFTVKAIPDTTGFRALLLTKLEGLTVPVKVVPVGAKGAIEAQLGGVTQVGKAGGTAAKTGAGAGAVENVERQTAAETKLSAAQKSLIQIQQSLTTAELRYAAAVKESISVEEKEEGLLAAKAAAKKADASATRQLAAVQGTLTKDQVDSLAATQASAASLRAKASAGIADIEAEKGRASVTTAANAATAEANAVLGINVKEIKTRAELQIISNDLAEADKNLKIQGAAATRVGSTALAGQLNALRKLMSAQLEEIGIQRASIKASESQSRAASQAARGAGSTVGTLLGARGATLAASGPFLIAAAATTIFAKSLKEFGQFEVALNTFKAVTGATADEMAKASAVARKLGNDISLPAVSAVDAANAMTELARAGLSVQDSLAGVRGVLQLAAATQIDNAVAANLTANALNAFSLAGSSAVHVADVLANAADASQGSVTDLGAGLESVGSVAHQVGISFEDTVAVLTQFTKAGLKGADAGTSFRSALVRLIAPTTASAALIKDLGLQIRDAQGNVRADVFAEFGAKTKDLPPALRDFIAATLGGQRAIRAFAIGAAQGAHGLELMKLQIDEEGTAARVAAARTEGLAGQFRGLTANAKTLGVTIGGIASGPVTALTSALNAELSAINELLHLDFKGFLKTSEEFSAPKLEGFKNIGEGLNPFANKGTLDGLKQTAKGLGQVVGVVGSDKVSRIKGLADELDRLQKLRIAEFQLRLPIGQITKNIETVRTKLKELGVSTDIAVPLTPIDKAKATVNETLDAVKALRAAQIKIHPELDTSGFDKSIVSLGRRLSDAGGLQKQIEGLQRQRKVLLDFSVHADTSKIDKEIKDLRRQVVQELLGLGNDAKKALTATDLAGQFELAFKVIAQSPKKVTPDLITSIQNMLRKISTVTPLSGAAGQKIGQELIGSLNDAVKAALKAGNPELAAQLQAFSKTLAELFKGDLQNAFKNIHPVLTADQLTKLVLPTEVAISQAELSGNIAAQIAGHAAERDQLLKQKASSKPKGQDLIELNARIKAQQDAIASINQQQASDAQTASNKADQAFLDSFSNRQQSIQNKIAAAANTPNTKDDIRFTRQLRDLYAEEIAQARTRISDAQKRNQTILTLQGELDRTNQDLANLEGAAFQKAFTDKAARLNKKLQAAQATASPQDDILITITLRNLYRREIIEARKRVKDVKERNAIVKDAQDQIDQANASIASLRTEQRNRAKQSLQLDIDFANTKGNIQGEINARELLIAELKKEQSKVKRTTLEYKQLRNDIATEQKAIEDLKKQQDAKKNAFAQLAFSFLNTQQGFAANLASNLLGNTAGLVGGSTPGSPSGALPLPPPRPPRDVPSGRVIDALSARGAGGSPAKATQMDTLIHLTREMVTLLGIVRAGAAHPEAKTSRALAHNGTEVGPA